MNEFQMKNNGLVQGVQRRAPNSSSGVKPSNSHLFASSQGFKQIQHIYQNKVVNFSNPSIKTGAMAMLPDINSFGQPEPAQKKQKSNNANTGTHQNQKIFQIYGNKQSQVQSRPLIQIQSQQTPAVFQQSETPMQKSTTAAPQKLKGAQFPQNPLFATSKGFDQKQIVAPAAPDEKRVSSNIGIQSLRQMNKMLTVHYNIHTSPKNAWVKYLKEARTTDNEEGNLINFYSQNPKPQAQLLEESFSKNNAELVSQNPSVVEMLYA